MVICGSNDQTFLVDCDGSCGILVLTIGVGEGDGGRTLRLVGVGACGESHFAVCVCE